MQSVVDQSISRWTSRSFKLTSSTNIGRSKEGTQEFRAENSPYGNKELRIGQPDSVDKAFVGPSFPLPSAASAPLFSRSVAPCIGNSLAHRGTNPEVDNAVSNFSKQEFFCAQPSRLDVPVIGLSTNHVNKKQESECRPLPSMKSLPPRPALRRVIRGFIEIPICEYISNTKVNYAEYNQRTLPSSPGRVCRRPDVDYGLEIPTRNPEHTLNGVTSG